MNKLTIVNNNGKLLVDSRQVAEMVGNDKIDIPKGFIDYITLYNIASELSFYDTKTNFTKALYLADVAHEIKPINIKLIFLEQAVRELIMSNWLKCQRNEFDIHKLFKNNITKIINNSKLITKKHNINNQPDCWVLINDLECPVEIKLHEFNLKALNQLNRYMDFYKSSFGIAVGSKLTVSLPDNIQFISIGCLEEF